MVRPPHSSEDLRHFTDWLEWYYAIGGALPGMTYHDTATALSNGVAAPTPLTV